MQVKEVLSGMKTARPFIRRTDLLQKREDTHKFQYDSSPVEFLTVLFTQKRPQSPEKLGVLIGFSELGNYVEYPEKKFRIDIRSAAAGTVSRSAAEDAEKIVKICQRAQLLPAAVRQARLFSRHILLLQLVSELFIRQRLVKLRVVLTAQI